MRVILNEADILTAIEDYILDTVKVPDDIRIDIDLKATRGAEGYTAEIDLIHFEKPVGTHDNTDDPRIQPTEEAREEGLGIVEKIDEARALAQAPRRRGRPAGSKNKPKDENPEAIVAAEPVKEETDVAPEPVETPATEEAATDDTVQATVEEAPEVVQPAEEVQPETLDPSTIVADPEPATPASGDRPSLFGGMSAQTNDDGPVEPDEEAVKEPEANSEAALAAEAQATEPEEEDVDYTPTPETAGLETEVAEGKDEDPAPKPVRSLFADLTKPKN